MTKWNTFTGHQVRAAMERLGLSQVALAERIGISEQFMSDVINGRRLFSQEMLLQAEAVLQTGGFLLVGAARDRGEWSFTVTGSGSPSRDEFFRRLTLMDRHLSHADWETLHSTLVGLDPAEEHSHAAWTPLPGS